MDKKSLDKYEISESEYEYIQSYFDLFDPHSTGIVDPHEIKKALDEMGE